MRRLASLLLVLGACDAVFRFQDVDEPIDAPLPAPDAACSFSRLLDTCQLGDPADWQKDVELTADAQSDVFVKIDNVALPTGTVHVVMVQKLGQLGGTTLAVTGQKPFVLVSDGDITLDGTVRGPAGGRSAADCALATGAPGVDNAGGAGGGGGGANGGAGGNGGKGDKDGNPNGAIAGGLGGNADPWTTDVLRGGCPGGAGGGTMSGSQVGGAGGGGGGAFAFISRTAIHISGKITVGGYAGSGGPGNALVSTGGGGGGAGGMIWLEAPMITIDGVLAANGGAGGEGGATGGSGRDGAGATTTDTPAAAGAGAGNGGDGGSGAHASHPDGYPATDWQNGGGGGGGGGVGIIAIVGRMVSITGMTTPNPTPAP